MKRGRDMLIDYFVVPGLSLADTLIFAVAGIVLAAAAVAFLVAMLAVSAAQWFTEWRRRWTAARVARRVREQQ